MTGALRSFDWRQIHADLERRSSRLATYENDETRVQALLRERSARLAMVPAGRAAAGPQARLLVFRAGGERFGLALEGTREICRIMCMAVLPGSSAALGIINWRGEFVILCDTARLFGLGSSEDGANPYAIVLRGSEPCIALAVGSLDGIVRFDLSELQAPDAMRSKQPELFKGITRDAVLVLEHGRLLGKLQDELRAA
jgi:chemotaxis signal transduction protein